MYIQHNMMAAVANRSLKENEGSKLKSLEKLNTGYQVNRAADNAAGLAISEKMRGQIRGLNQAERNIQDGIGFVQTAEGALSEIQDMMHRIHELAVQAANDTNTPEDRECLDNEIQMYKEEIDYMFRETEFNTIKIWDTHTNNKVQIGIESRQAVKLQSFSTKSFRVTETNKGAIAYNGYTIEVQGTDQADPATYGFKVTWEGWNQKPYSTELISWDDAASGRTFGMNLSDHVDLDTYPELKGIDFRIAWTAEEAATIDDIAASIDGVRFTSSETSSESTILNQTSPGVSFSVTTYYLAELASGRNVDAYDTTWIEPAPTGTTNVITQPSYSDPQEDTGWKIHFTMPNIGKVTATSSYIDYYANDRDAAAENLWWSWVYPTNSPSYKGTIWHTPDRGQGNLLGVTDCLTDSAGNGDSITKNAETGGRIDVRFDITPDSGSFQYEGRKGTSIGYLHMQVTGKDDDTEESIMNKIKAALNTDTILDIYEGNEQQGTPYTTSGYLYRATANRHII
ncbi:MAG: flagellin, partial [Lachnospiraceae bacterium]|nr:flagellin [Lachnospiraceae bacterium]